MNADGRTAEIRASWALYEYTEVKSAWINVADLAA